ncbi:MAG: 50S ribosomal protein L24 [Firmicutes bacterium]|jgi:large subunit ribosomal protein L24|nr:50S ribosomal protein L24 [Bacillota bacterium]
MASVKLKIKTGDNVQVLSGKDKGKKGKVIAAYPRERLVKVEGINIIKKHAKPTQKVPQGGIREMEAPMHISKVMILCPACGKTTRVGRKDIGERLIRVCKKCGESLDK